MAVQQRPEGWLAEARRTHPWDPDTVEHRMTAMIMQHWLAALRGQFGGFPRDLLVLDLETTGFSKANDLIVSIGHVIVEDGVVADRMEAFLNWADHPGVNQVWLEDKMRYTAEKMAERGRTYQISYADLYQKGVEPIGVLESYYQLLVEMRAAGYGFVMHNGYNFDAPFLCNHFHRWLGKDLAFGDNEIWDTGVIEKASQINSIPDRRDTMRAWAKRVGAARVKDVHWGLADHCVPKYDLAARFGLDPTQAHGAGYDSYVTHLLFEEFRRLAAETPPQVDHHADPPQDGPPGQDDDPGGRYAHLGG